MANELRRLLTYVVENPVMEIEKREAELNATAVQDVVEEIAEINEDQRADAARLAPYFEEGLKRAAREGGKVTVDDTDTMGNGIADAFARFMVTTGLATSQSQEIGENHYRYTFELDWERLRRIAQRAGIDLDSAVRET
ncbi:MAG: hypothetical protein WCD37_00060 [Chloroflexia bacterium]